MKKTFESTQTAVRTPLKLAAAAAAALLILSGCAVGPNYTRPSAVSQMPAQFKEAPAGWKSATPNDAALKGDWWTMYGDPVLNSLESQVEINNQNVAQYAQKYLQAVALVAQSDAALYPSITAGASGSRGLPVSPRTPSVSREISPGNRISGENSAGPGPPMKQAPKLPQRISQMPVFPLRRASPKTILRFAFWTAASRFTAKRSRFIRRMSKL